MATSPIPQWAREMSPTHRGPTAGGILVLALLAVLVALVLQSLAGTEGGAHQAPTSTVPACAQHFPPTCKGR